jgi:hypothetical protein
MMMMMIRFGNRMANRSKNHRRFLKQGAQFLLVSRMMVMLALAPRSVMIVTLWL